MRSIDLSVAAADDARPTEAALASPWPIFWVSSIAVFLVSLDTTMLYAAFGAMRASFRRDARGALMCDRAA